MDSSGAAPAPVVMDLEAAAAVVVAAVIVVRHGGLKRRDRLNAGAAVRWLFTTR